MLRLWIMLLAALLPVAASANTLTTAFSAADKKQWPEARAAARSSSSKAAVTVIAWLAMLDPDSRTPFSEFASFLAKHPDWPEQRRLQTRAEIALVFSNPSAATMQSWFDVYPPITGLAKAALAATLWEADRTRATELLREAWRDGDFDEARERALITTYGEILQPDDHWQRADRLVWEEKYTAATRMLPLLSSSQMQLIEARMKLAQDDKSAPDAVARLPSEVRNDVGLIYERMRWRARSEDDLGVREMLLMAPAEVPYPAKWWKPRELQIRKSIDEGDLHMARKLAGNHGQIEGQPYAEALWLNGWLHLVFLNEPQEAGEIFHTMFDAVKFPVSKARAAYWAGRAAKKIKDTAGMQQWYATAAAYPTTFYGQVASMEIYDTTPLRIPPPPALDKERRQRFFNSEIAKAVKAAVDGDAADVAGSLLNTIIDNAANDEEVAYAVALAQSLKKPDLAVRAAKRAMMRNVVITEAGYPNPKTPDNLPVPRLMALALARQESEFDTRAKSASGAVGLMQLMPATAKGTAHKAKIGYAPKQLYESDYNFNLGSLYFSQMLSSFHGSMVLSIAAYNAGPGRVRQWINQFGEPHRNVESTLNWIEKIPYEETRTYVQRVLENLQVYRLLLEGEDKLKLKEDLLR